MVDWAPWGAAVTELRRHFIDDLYGGRPPRGAAHALQAQVSRLRQLLTESTIELLPLGYRLKVDADDVDASRFERMAEEGRNALGSGQPRQATVMCSRWLRRHWVSRLDAVRSNGPQGMYGRFWV